MKTSKIICQGKDSATFWLITHVQFSKQLVEVAFCSFSELSFAVMCVIIIVLIVDFLFKETSLQEEVKCSYVTSVMPPPDCSLLALLCL